MKRTNVKESKMKLAIIAVVVLMGTVGCTESNEETVKAFNEGKLIDCRTGLWQEYHNIVDNISYTYSEDLGVFTDGNTAFDINACFSRRP